MVYIASDHGGFELKQKLVEYLVKMGFQYKDLGPFEYIADDDYPDYVKPLAENVAASSENCGIVICRNGVGVSMLANKFKGIRCALSWNPRHAASSRNDDNTNVLALPADYISPQEAEETVKSWLSTPFSNANRYIRRLKKVMETEK
jgi:ribose 5-phosphate isomerase B